MRSDVDGILGFDALRSFAATELDLSSRRLRLHNRPYSASDDGRREGAACLEMQARLCRACRAATASACHR